MGSRGERRAIAAETLEVLASGSYTLQDGQSVDLSAALERAVLDTELVRADDGIPCASSSSQVRDTTVEVTGETTLEAAMRLHSELEGLDGGQAVGANALCVLNFASAKNPGGGFQGGAQAQEESLARSSGLYPCLQAHVVDFYTPHRKDPQGGLYSDAMLYSPGVSFFRDDAGTLCPVWHAAVITAPAPNAGAARCGRETLLDVLRRRCGRVLRLARVRGLSHLILGAWGCGVFKNDPEDVAAAFDFWLNRSPEFRGAFQRIVFAIPGGIPQNQQAFSRYFGGGGPPPESPTGAGTVAGASDRGQVHGRSGGGRGAGRKSDRRQGRWRKSAGAGAEEDCLPDAAYG